MRRSFDPKICRSSLRSAFRSPLPLRHAPRPSDRGSLEYSLLASRSTTAARRRPLRHPLLAPATTPLSRRMGVRPFPPSPPLVPAPQPPPHHQPGSWWCGALTSRMPGSGSGSERPDLDTSKETKARAQPPAVTAISLCPHDRHLNWKPARLRLLFACLCSGLGSS